MTSPWPQSMARGVVWELLLRRGPAPGSPAAPAAGCAMLRAGASPAGRAPLEGRHGGGLRKQRGEKDKGAARRNEGETGMGGQRKGGLLFFIVLLSPGYTEGKQRTAIKGL